MVVKKRKLTMFFAVVLALQFLNLLAKMDMDMPHLQSISECILFVNQVQMHNLDIQLHKLLQSHTPLTP